MPACLSRSVGLPPIFPASASSLKTMQMEDHSQGLISGENGKRVAVSVLRRTLSATEMCSKMWIAQGGGGAIKKTSSVEHLDSMIHDKEEGNGSGSGSRSEAFQEIWSSIQRKTSTEELEQRKTSTDVWGSILSDKKDDVAKGGCEDVPPAPYVHPLVKRSASSLSEKSLEICTESLGSETGSDVFSFLDADKELIGNDVVVVADEMNQQPRQQEVKEVWPAVEIKAVEYSAAGATRTKRAAAAVAGEGNDRSFPPPLPSLGHGGDGSNVQMRCHRQDGRLVVEAVSVPSRNCFRAERQGGRLLLTFSGKESSPEEENHVSEEEDEEWDQEEDDEEEESMEKEVNERATEKGGMMTMMKYVDYKFLCLTRRSACSPPTPWAQRLNKVVPSPESDDVAKSSPHYLKGAQLIPATVAASLNPYVYSWRSNGGATVAEVKEVGNVQHAPPRSRSVLFWPDTTRCIATA